METGPRRTCTGCRARRRQDALIRVVRAPEGLVVATGRRAAGRGAYVCRDVACVEAALASGALKRALRYEGDLPAGIRSELVREAVQEVGETGVVGEEGADGQA